MTADQVIVTHDLDLMRRVADRVVFMDEGRIVEVGTPDDDDVAVEQGANAPA